AGAAQAEQAGGVDRTEPWVPGESTTRAAPDQSKLRSRRASPTDSEASRIARLIHDGKRSGYIRLTWRGMGEVFRRSLRSCRESSPFLGSDRRVVAAMTR